MVEKYFNQLHDTDGTGEASALLHMRKEVPANLQSELYAQLIDRASKDLKNSDVIGGVLSQLLNMGAEFAWNMHLKNSVLALIHSHPGYRKLLARLLCQTKFDENRDTCEALLNDPDDQVRVSAIKGIAQSGKGKEILKKYIVENNGSTKHAESLSDARLYLKAADEHKK